MTNINKLSQTSVVDSSNQDKSLNELQDKRLNESQKRTIGETREEITTEKFRNMSLEQLIDNMTIKDNKILIFGKDINYFYEHVLLPEDIAKFREAIDSGSFKIKKQFDERDLLIDIIKIWYPEAINQVGAMWFKWMRDADEIILGENMGQNGGGNIGKILDLAGNFGVPVSDNIFKTQSSNIFDLIIDSEKQKGIIGPSDMQKVKKIFFEDLVLEEKQLKIFNLMRYGGWSGNSEGVKDILANKLLETEDFSQIKEKLETSNLQELIEDNNKEELEKLFGEKLTKELLNIYKKTNKSLEKKLYLDFEEKNKKRILNKEPALVYEDYYKEKKQEIEMQVFISTIDVFKKVLIGKKIESKSYRGDKEKTLTGMYANIIGLGETSSGDFTTIADENIDLAIDFATTIALGAITVGTGSLAISGARLGGIAFKNAVTGTRLANYGSKILGRSRAASYFEKGTKARGFLGFMGKASYEGISFYEGATLAQNLLLRDIKDWNEGLIDKKEFVKNIAFMGALNSLSYLSRLPGMTRIMDFNMKIPDEYLKAGNMKKVIEGAGTFGFNALRDGSIMFGISQGIDITELLLEGRLKDWKPTVREYIEFIVLIQVLHLKDKSLLATRRN